MATAATALPSGVSERIEATHKHGDQSRSHYNSAPKPALLIPWIPQRGTCLQGETSLSPSEVPCFFGRTHICSLIGWFRHLCLVGDTRLWSSRFSIDAKQRQQECRFLSLVCLGLETETLDWKQRPGLGQVTRVKEGRHFSSCKFGNGIFMRCPDLHPRCGCSSKRSRFRESRRDF